MTSLLLDTHTLLWAAHQPSKLSVRAREALLDEEIQLLVSPVSAMEIATKERIGKLEHATDLARNFVRQVNILGAKQLFITAEHAQMAGLIDSPHKDPWDRLLAAQSAIEGVALVTVDPFFDAIGTNVFW